MLVTVSSQELSVLFFMFDLSPLRHVLSDFFTLILVVGTLHLFQR